MVFYGFCGASTNSRRCMALPLVATRVNHGGIMVINDAIMVQNSACMIKPISP